MVSRTRGPEESYESYRARLKTEKERSKHLLSGKITIRGADGKPEQVSYRAYLKAARAVAKINSMNKLMGKDGAARADNGEPARENNSTRPDEAMSGSDNADGVGSAGRGEVIGRTETTDGDIIAA